MTKITNKKALEEKVDALATFFQKVDNLLVWVTDAEYKARLEAFKTATGDLFKDSAYGSAVLMWALLVFLEYGDHSTDALKAEVQALYKHYEQHLVDNDPTIAEQLASMVTAIRAGKCGKSDDFEDLHDKPKSRRRV